MAMRLLLPTLLLTIFSANAVATGNANPNKKTARGVAIEATKEMACMKAHADEQAQLKTACRYDGGMNFFFAEECKFHVHDEKKNNYFAEKKTIYYCKGTASQDTAPPSNFSNLVEKANHEERQDKLALRSALERAEQCTNMQCTIDAFAEASKFTRNVNDRNLVFAARERADVRVGLLAAEEDIKTQAQKAQDARDLEQAVRAGQEYMRAMQEGIAQQQREQEAAAVFGSVLNQLGGAAAAAAARRQPAATQRQPQVAPRAASTGNRTSGTIAQPINNPGLDECHRRRQGNCATAR